MTPGDLLALQVQRGRRSQLALEQDRLGLSHMECQYALCEPIRQLRDDGAISCARQYGRRHVQGNVVS